MDNRHNNEQYIWQPQNTSSPINADSIKAFLSVALAFCSALPPSRLIDPTSDNIVLITILHAVGGLILIGSGVIMYRKNSRVGYKPKDLAYVGAFLITLGGIALFNIFLYNAAVAIPKMV
jgi:hypothetical protein